MSNKNQASKSHPEDTLGSHSKKSQTPVPANSQSGTTSRDIHESRDVTQKTKPTPAHVGPWKVPGEERESLREGAFRNRQHPGDAKEIPNAAARARRAIHGK